jgi:hypothetical protein
MRRTTVLLAVLLVMAATVGACSQQKDPTAAELKDDLVEDLREVDADLSVDQAECYAGLLVDKVGVKDLADVRFSDAEPSTEDGVADKIAEAAIAAREDCDIAEAPR